MRRATWILLLPVALLGACVEQPPPQAVPVYAEAEDMFVLEGEWWGQYWSAETGRSGRIRLSLEAEADRAYGDVLMLSSDREENRGTTSRPEPVPPPSETLTIEFVREDNPISGYNHTELPWAPSGVAMWRYDLATRVYQHQIADDGWTNPRWVKAGLLSPELGKLVVWRENDWRGYVLEPAPTP